MVEADVMARFADELRAAIADKAAWFPMPQGDSLGTFIAVGRKDGGATVVVNSGGWQVVHHVDGSPVVEQFGSAADAVDAALAFPPVVVPEPVAS